nr:hypothetical protein [Tanacetum cinerariifolium]
MTSGREITPPPGFPAVPIITTMFTATTHENTPMAYRASTSVNPNPVISLDFIEANYEALKSLLRYRHRQMRNNDLLTELEYFSEDYDEEREMKPRSEPTRAATPPLRIASPRICRFEERTMRFEGAQSRGQTLKLPHANSTGKPPYSGDSCPSPTGGARTIDLEAVKSGQLAQLVKGVKEKKQKTTGTRSEEKTKEEKKPWAMDTTIPICCIAVLPSSKLCGESDFMITNVSVFVTVMRPSPIVTSKGVSLKGHDCSPEKPKRGVFESTRRDPIDGFSFKKQCSYITSHELPPSRCKGWSLGKKGAHGIIGGKFSWAFVRAGTNASQEHYKRGTRRVGWNELESEANGQVEVTNREIIKGMKRRLGRAHQAWIDDLPQVLWAYRTTPKSSNRETTFSLVYGSEAVIPIEICVETKRVQEFYPKENKKR